jgi:hypothetical protein
MVLLKKYGPEGFTFYTNYTSRKASELDSNPRYSIYYLPSAVILGQNFKLATGAPPSNPKVAEFFIHSILGGDCDVAQG